MARNTNRLTALAVSRAKAKGMYPDGAGLYLHVSESGAASWIYSYMFNRRPREMGLGPLSVVSLSEARRKADECRRLRVQGIDPIEARNDQRDKARIEAAQSITFKEAADAYIKSHQAGWRSAKHAKQWQNTLDTYVDPVFGSMPVPHVDVSMVMKVLEPIWATKTETAGRVRSRIEAVLDWAAARGYRKGENPARWRGHLDNLLPGRAKVRRVKHHAALPYADMHSFMQELHLRDGVARYALEFLILTATRTSETIGCRWSEINLEKAVWTIPADRIKGGREHRVPLSTPALAILKQRKKIQEGNGQIKKLQQDNLVFTGGI